MFNDRPFKFYTQLRGRSTKDSYTQWPISGRGSGHCYWIYVCIYEHVYFSCYVRHWTDSVFVRTLSCFKIRSYLSDKTLD